MVRNKFNPLFMNFFEKVPQAPIDSVFGLRIAYEQDDRKLKVDLGVGVYRTADLKPHILQAVKQAEEHLLKEEVNKEYLPIAGDVSFLQEAFKLIFQESVEQSHVACVQAVGGTGALRIGGEFLIEYISKNLFLSSPTWDNHKRIFSKVGFSLNYYSYYDQTRRCLNLEGMIEAIKNMPPKSILFLQGCCHNPTGFDPSFDEWQTIASLALEKQLLPFFDFAYQGFGDGLEDDAKALRYFVQRGLPVLVAASFSKNFGLYAERVGALFVVTKNSSEKTCVESQLKLIIRGLYSNPPCHGARVVSLILRDAQLRQKWEKELQQMRERIKKMRANFYTQLQLLGDSERFAFLTKQKGMFSYLGISETEVNRLIAEYGIYMLKEGRISIPGLNSDNLPYVASAIHNILVS